MLGCPIMQRVVRMLIASSQEAKTCRSAKEVEDSNGGAASRGDSAMLGKMGNVPIKIVKANLNEWAARLASLGCCDTSFFIPESEPRQIPFLHSGF